MFIPNSALPAHTIDTLEEVHVGRTDGTKCREPCCAVHGQRECCCTLQIHRGGKGDKDLHSLLKTGSGDCERVMLSLEKPA